MNRVIQIFKKDASHLWPRILVFAATLVLFVCEDPTYVTHQGGLGQFTSLLYLLLPLACWLLVTSLIQEEKTLGHEQYWLTRPFTWTELLAAKALFLLTFVLLPVFVCQAAVLSANGFSPVEYFGNLLVKQVFFSALLLLPIAAMAAVTRSLGHAFLGGLLLAMSLGAAAGLLAATSSGWRWGALSWIPATAVAAVSLAGASAVIFLQYTRRRAALGRSVLAGAALLVVVVWALPPWQPAFGIQSWFSKRQIDPKTVRISFDPENAAKAPALHGNGTGVYLQIPIRLENLPAGLEVATDWISVESPWRSGWTADSGIRGNASGNRWLALEVDADSFDRFKNSPIRLRGSLDLTLVAPTSELSEFGQCWVEVSTMYYCLSPLPRARLTRVSDGGNSREPVPGTGVDAPYPTSPWFGPLQKYSAPNILGENRLVVDRPVAHIRRSFDFGPLRPAAYRVEVD